MRMAILIGLLEIAAQIKGARLDMDGGNAGFILFIFFACLLQDVKELFK